MKIKETVERDCCQQKDLKPVEGTTLIVKIKETVERDCCQQKDLKPVEGTTLIGRIPEFVFCIYCGKHHEYEPYMDAAGARDWRYKPLPLVK